MNEFKLVQGQPTNEDMEKEVTKLLNDGWDLAGPMTDDGNFFIQPMVKYGFPRNIPPPQVAPHCSKCCTNNMPGWRY